MAEKNIPESSEESKARHTPGPFYIQGSHLIRKFAEDRHIAIGPAPTVAYQSEVVSLLNKGSHYDGVLQALKALLEKHIEVCEKEYCTGPHNKGWGEDEEPIRSALAAIAKAEGTDD